MHFIYGFGSNSISFINDPSCGCQENPENPNIIFSTTDCMWQLLVD